MLKNDLHDRGIAVFGAGGHTGRFVVDELERRGLRAIRIGRDLQKIAAVGEPSKSEPARVARVDDQASLDAALAGAAALINCAGPFVDTAIPLIDAALRAGIPYFAVAAEQAVVQSVFDTRDEAARAAGVSVVPAAAFYGGLADLLASAVAGDAENIDEISVVVGLDSWHPTGGTRLTGQRNTAPRVVQRNGRLEPVPATPATGQWDFPEPIGTRQIIMLPLSEIITLTSHLKVDTVTSWMNVEPLQDLRDPATPPPQPSDELGRSPQRFVMDVVVKLGAQRRRARATGRDIYQVSAPIIVETVERLLAGSNQPEAGVYSLGAMFDAKDFLSALGNGTIEVSYADVPA